MACLLCGDVCGCLPDDRRLPGSASCSAVPSNAGRPPARSGAEPVSVDLHGVRPGEARRESFVRSSELPGGIPIDSRGEPGPALEAGSPARDASPQQGEPHAAREPSEDVADPAGVAPTQFLLAPFRQAGRSDDSDWRTQVSERLHRYRSRKRTPAPRQASLRLKFESPETDETVPTSTGDQDFATQSEQSSLSAATPWRQAVAADCAESPPASEPPPPETGPPRPAPEPLLEGGHAETTARIIAFSRTPYSPPVPVNELADPVIDRPRILDAPEIVPPPPALGGILMEGTLAQEPERRPGVDMPIEPASFLERSVAATIDALVVLLAGGVFGAAFYWIARVRLPPRQIISVGAAMLGVLWAAYQYLLIVYAGTTLGLCAMRLELQRFDTRPADRRQRRWCVLAGILSGVSLGMGYAWQFLDEDGLCWHERITKTYLAPSRN